jgi:hypothetical protein
MKRERLGFDPDAEPPRCGSERSVERRDREL